MPADMLPSNGGLAAGRLLRLTRLRGLAATLRRPGMGRSISRTAGFNFASALTAGLGGVILARSLGPTIRGEYAAVTSWFGVTLMVGGMGQPAALCFHVARYPGRAREYVATSRAMMMTTGAVALTAGMLLASRLAHGNPEVTTAYRIVFGASILAFVGASYTFSLQARDMRRWNVVRVSQPVMSLVAIVVLWRLGLLTLESVLIVLAATMLLQLCWAYRACRVTGLAPGKARADLVRPLGRYGVSQIAALTPAAVNAQLDQLVLSQTVPPAQLGRYAIAVSLTLLPIPLVSAIGYVAFPRLAAQHAVTDGTLRLQRLAVLGSAGLTAAMLAPLALTAYWLVPLVFGAAYRGAVPLVWILTPGTVFLSCGGVVSDLLRGRNRPVIVAWSQGLAAVFTVGLLIALLPVVGVYGAAIASTVSYGVALGVMLRCLARLPRDTAGNNPGNSADKPDSADLPALST
jgi:O-antigen/teichoic acid export membrane protein